MVTVRHALGTGALTLSATAGKQARLEAEAILASVLGVSRAWLFAHPDEDLSAADGARFLRLVARRANCEPLEYVLGRGEFFGLSLALTPDVLVPRPETETLVTLALAAVAPDAQPLVLDVGTGSGAIALAIASRHPGARVVATDVSMAALAVAAGNRRTLGLGERVHLVCSHLLDALWADFDLIAANLPYVATADLSGVSAPVVRYEPRLALDGGPDGLALVRALLHQAAACLKPGGTLLAEIGSMQGAYAMAIAAPLFGTARVEVLPDAYGQDRVLRAVRAL